MSHSASSSSTPDGSQPIRSASASNPWLLWVEFRRNCFWSALLGTLIASISAFIVYGTFSPEYCATHILEANREYVVFPGVLQAPGDLVQNEKPVIYNPIVLTPVLADAKVCEAPSLVDPIKREANLRRNLSVSDAGSRTLMQISYKDTDPKAAAMVCKAIVRSYLDQRQRFDDRRISDLEAWLRPAVEFWQGEVEDCRKRIVTLSKSTKRLDPVSESSRYSADVSYLNSVRDKLSMLRIDESLLAAESALVNKSKEVAEPYEIGSLVAQRTTSRSPNANEFASLQARRAVLERDYEAEVSRLSRVAGETSELYFAEQKYMQASSTLSKLNERIASIRTERQKSSSMQTVAEVVPPTQPEELVPWTRMLIVAAIGFVVSVGLGSINFLNTALWKIWGRSP